MQGVITLNEVLREIDKPGNTFAITWIQADRRKGTGGKIDSVKCAQKTTIADLPDNIVKFNRIAESTKRNPNHWDHKTRNIYVPATRRIKKLHIKLITEFNGKTVVL